MQTKKVCLLERSRVVSERAVGGGRRSLSRRQRSRSPSSSSCSCWPSVHIWPLTFDSWHSRGHYEKTHVRVRTDRPCTFDRWHLTAGIRERLLWENYHKGICGEFVWVRFPVVCFLYKTNLNPRKNICCGKKWSLFFLGLGWPWVGEFDSFIITFVLFPTLQNSVNRKHHNNIIWVFHLRNNILVPGTGVLVP